MRRITLTLIVALFFLGAYYYTSAKPNPPKLKACLKKASNQKNIEYRACSKHSLSMIKICRQGAMNNFFKAQKKCECQYGNRPESECVERPPCPGLSRDDCLKYKCRWIGNEENGNCSN